MMHRRSRTKGRESDRRLLLGLLPESLHSGNSMHPSFIIQVWQCVRRGASVSRRRGGKQREMLATGIRRMGWAALLSTLVLPQVWARDLRVTIPRHSEMTLVQRLNRDGVDAVRKQQYEKAEALFLKAYLYDPADPFTLNNLGYISELQGQLDRALKFYKLAAQ